MIDKIFSEVIKRLTNRHFKIVVLVLGVGFVLFSDRRFFELVRKFCVNLFNLCSTNWCFTLGLLIPLTLIYFLLRKSTKLFNQDWEKHYPIIERWESNGNRILQITIIDNHRDQTREILIYNTRDSDLHDLEGEVKLYHHDYHFESIPFRIKCLEKRKGEKIILENYNTKKKQFNEFHTFIDKCKNLELNAETQKIYGKRFFRTHSLILNGCRFFLWWEYSWLREKYRELFAWIKYQYTIPAIYEHVGYWQYYSERPWCYLGKLKGEPWRYFWKRKLNQTKMIIVYLFLVGVFLFFNYSFYRIGRGVFEIVKSLQ